MSTLVRSCPQSFSAHILFVFNTKSFLLLGNIGGEYPFPTVISIPKKNACTCFQFFPFVPCVASAQKERANMCDAVTFTDALMQKGMLMGRAHNSKYLVLAACWN